MERKINYSIIIPHKNIPNLLRRCLDSIPRRDDVQIIVVDDNSDPDIVNFEQFPGLNDPFVEVFFTKEGKGAGFARNIGLTKAVGKWLLFADADDFYNYCINDILNDYLDSDYDIIYFLNNSVDSDFYTTTYRCIGSNNLIKQWLNSSKKNDALLRYRRLVIWSKIFKKEFVNKYSIVFDEVSISDDTTFGYLTGHYASSVYADARALYCSTIRQDSLQHSKRSFEKKITEFYVICKYYKFYREHNIPFTYNFSIGNFLIKSFLQGREYYYKAKNIMLELGFTSGEIIKLCLYAILIYNPKKVLLKLFSRPQKIP